MKSKRDFDSWCENLEARLHKLQAEAAALVDCPSSRDYSDLQLRRDLDYRLFDFENKAEIEIIEDSALARR